MKVKRNFMSSQGILQINFWFQNLSNFKGTVTLKIKKFLTNSKSINFSVQFLKTCEKNSKTWNWKNFSLIVCDSKFLENFFFRLCVKKSSLSSTTTCSRRRLKLLAWKRMRNKKSVQWKYRSIGYNTFLMGTPSFDQIDFISIIDIFAMCQPSRAIYGKQQLLLYSLSYREFCFDLSIRRDSLQHSWFKFVEFGRMEQKNINYLWEAEWIKWNGIHRKYSSFTTWRFWSRFYDANENDWMP